MSEMDAAAAAECAPALPEDAVSEILARVPDMVSLFRCAVVCKRWRRLVADPAFLRRFHWPEGGRSSLLGFFVQRHQRSANARRKISKLFPSLAPVFVPAPGSALGPGRRFLTSFVRDEAGLLDKAKPLAARDGLLVRLFPRSSDNSVLRLCVYNLLTDRRDLLPPLDAACFGDEGATGYAVLTAADHGAGPHRPADGYSTFFQVLLTGLGRHGHVYLGKFSSDAAASRSWSCISSHIVPGLLWAAHECRIAAVTGGTAHWLFLGMGPNGLTWRTLDVSINTGHVAVTEIPSDVRSHIRESDRCNVSLCLSIDARLSLFSLNKNNQLHIWTRQDGNQGGTEVWHLTQAIQVGGELRFFGIESLSTVCIGEMSSTMLARYVSDPDHAYVVDLQSGSMTMVAGWKWSFNYMTAVPYEINWLEFFVSRLGVQL